MTTEKIPYKTYLAEEELPRTWYNVRADMKVKPAPLLNPATGAPIKGFTFPDWDRAVELVKSAAQVVPEVGYVGWDVCFTPEGPCLVEGNQFPGHDIYQLPVHTPDKIGIMPRFRAIQAEEEKRGPAL